MVPPLTARLGRSLQQRPCSRQTPAHGTQCCAWAAAHQRGWSWAACPPPPLTQLMTQPQADCDRQGRPASPRATPQRPSRGCLAHLLPVDHVPPCGNVLGAPVLVPAGPAAGRGRVWAGGSRPANRQRAGTCQQHVRVASHLLEVVGVLPHVQAQHRRALRVRHTHQGVVLHTTGGGGGASIGPAWWALPLLKTRGGPGNQAAKRAPVRSAGGGQPSQASALVLAFPPATGVACARCALPPLPAACAHLVGRGGDDQLAILHAQPRPAGAEASGSSLQGRQGAGEGGRGCGLSAARHAASRAHPSHACCRRPTGACHSRR